LIALEELRVLAEELEQQNGELDRARREQETARLRYLELFDLAPDAYLVTDPGGIILEANRAASTLLRVGHRPLLGKPFSLFLARADREAFYLRLGRLTNGTGGSAEGSWELSIWPRGGKPVPVSAAVTLVCEGSDRLTGLRFLLRDVSDLKRAEEAIREAQAGLEWRVKERTAQLQAANARLEREIRERSRMGDALRESEQRYRTLVEHAPEAVVVLDVDQGRFVEANENAEHLFEARREALFQVGPVEMSPLVQPDGRPSVEAAAQKINEALEGKVPVFEWMHRSASGQAIPCEVRLVRLPASSQRLVRGSIMDISDRKRTEEQIRSLAYRDPLTGLPNRLLFGDRLALAVAQAHREQQRLAILFLDLDRFKVVNDSLGHRLGDQLLLAVAERLKSSVREGDTVARIGGDEFTLLLPGVASPAEGFRAAQKVLAALRPPYNLDGHELFVTASMGVSFFPEGGQDAEGLVKNADSAMYLAKEEGRDCARLYMPGMSAQAQERLALESNLRRTLEKNEFLLHYQPIIDVKSGAIRAVEALVRWPRPRRGPIPPAEFVPVAEVTGLIVPIGMWVLKTACAQVAAWQRVGHSQLRLAVNISPRQFQQKDLVAQVERVLAATHFRPDCLDLEITEGAAMPKTERAARVLRDLKQLGVGISLDDFGTGYSSLSFLRRLPIDVVKIDHSFVRDLVADPDDAAIIHGVIVMAHSLNLRVVAEGVETPEQFAYLRAHQCDLAQGFLFSAPISAHECEGLLGKRLPSI
jgi:diguanylate cyclase (GGDEF)-like protein/PAS domain S-box-containing protein